MCITDSTTWIIKLFIAKLYEKTVSLGGTYCVHILHKSLLPPPKKVTEDMLVTQLQTNKVCHSGIIMHCKY